MVRGDVTSEKHRTSRRVIDGKESRTIKTPRDVGGGRWEVRCTQEDPYTYALQLVHRHVTTVTNRK